MSKPPGTPVALSVGRGMMMEPIVRVSAVFLLILGIWVCGVWGGEVHRRGSSAQRSVLGDDVGVGTKAAVLCKEASKDARVHSTARIDPLKIFGAVEKGWRDGTPKPFEGYLGKGKVRLDFGEGGPRGGLFTRSQAYYLLADYLRRAQTVRIGIARMSDGSKKGSRPHALLERLCRYSNGVARKEIIFVSLSREDDRWVISELRVVPAK
jgi:hypothetical protein